MAKNDYKNAKFQNIILAISAFMLMGLSANLTNSAIYLNTGTTLNIMHHINTLHSCYYISMFRDSCNWYKER